MARWQPTRRDVIAEYAAEVAEVFSRGRIVVGIDGVEAPVAGEAPAAREAFAGDLARAFAMSGVPAAAVRLGDLLARAPFDPGLDPAALVDLPRFRDQVLAPYRAGRPVETASGPFAPGQRGVLVVSGPFAHLGDLAGVWHTSAWLQAPRDEVWRRDAARLGLAEDGPELAAWAAAVRRAFARVDARKAANATFDVTDPEHPRRRFEDAC